jgi:hypothetical protein
MVLEEQDVLDGQGVFSPRKLSISHCSSELDLHN